MKSQTYSSEKKFVLRNFLEFHFLTIHQQEKKKIKIESEKDLFLKERQQDT